MSVFVLLQQSSLFKRCGNKECLNAIFGMRLRQQIEQFALAQQAATHFQTRDFSPRRASISFTFRIIGTHALFLSRRKRIRECEHVMPSTAKCRSLVPSNFHVKGRNE